MLDIDEENYLLLETHHKMAAKRVAVAVGRFNPPTRGHYFVFDKLKSFIRKNPELKLQASPVVLIISGKNAQKDKHKNPLSAEDRIKFMKASGKANGVLFVTASNVVEGFNALRKYGFEPIAIAAGEERASSYIEILDKYFNEDSGKKIKHYKVELPRENFSIANDNEASNKELLKKMKDDGYEPDIDEISGSLAKLAVQMGYLDEFLKITGLESNTELGKKMFNKIKEVI